jgi:hypothetical protein
MARSPKGRPAPAKVPETEAPDDPSLCPRCGGKLTDPDGLGWCPGCGYCRSIEEEGKAIAAAPPPPAPKQPSLLGASEFGEAMRRMPHWAWPLLGGMALVIAISAAADYLLPEECLARALWSAIQMVLSIVGIITAQLWVALLVGADEDGLGAKDVILPGRSWRTAIRRLPATRKPVWLGAWCATGLVCGVAVVGGFNYWLEAVKQGRVRRLAERLAGETAQDTGRELKVILEPPTAPAPPAATGDGGVTQCAVIGYQTDGRTVTALVLAMAEGDQLLFAGVVREGLDAEVRRDLMSQLPRMRRTEPLIPGLKIYGTVWVKPGVYCDVTLPRKGESGEPTFQGLHD